MAPLWEDSVCRGTRCEEGVEKDSNTGNDQTWMLESEEPVRRKFESGDMESVVMG